MLAALAAVWTINFFVVPPIIGTGFAHLLPYAVSLTSKLLFGAAAAEVVRNRAFFRAPIPVLADRKARTDKTHLT
jgi:hypothetical protein